MLVKKEAREEHVLIIQLPSGGDAVIQPTGGDLPRC